MPAPAVVEAIYDVVADYGADPTGNIDATTAIQAAIDDAQIGQGAAAVYLPAGLYRCDGSLNVTRGNLSLRGAGKDLTKLYFTQSAGFGYRAHISFQGLLSRGEDMPLAANAPNRATVVQITDASSVSVGDTVALGWVITDAFIAEHGMKGVWSQFNGQWKPFFRREVVAVDLSVTPHEVHLDIPTRYLAQLRDGASLRKETGYLAECRVEDLSLSNAVGYDQAWSENQIHLLAMKGVRDAVIRNVSSFASPHPDNAREHHLQSGGILITDSTRVTAKDCTLEKAQNRGGGGNGYLFEVRSSGEVLFSDCTGRSGRHNFIQNWDFGATGIVWLRCLSEGSQNVTRAGALEFPLRADSEYHHSLAMANLVDQCVIKDGWSAGNRGTESSGAGHSATQCVIWNMNGGGSGRIRSFNSGHGYVIGTTAATVYVNSDITLGSLDEGTDPIDFTEHLGNGSTLWPPSLYEDQRMRRMSSQPEGEGTTPAPHAADTNEDRAIDLGELLRLVQLYNADGLHCAEETEDGYAPGTGEHTCPAHTADYAPQDWLIALSELLRGIQLYRYGNYHACDAGEDGFCAAP